MLAAVGMEMLKMVEQRRPGDKIDIQRVGQEQFEMILSSDFSDGVSGDVGETNCQEEGQI